MAGSPTFKVTVQHRDETDVVFTDASSFTDITSTGDSQLDIGGLKQIVRFKYHFDTGDVGDVVHFLMQAPSWRPYD